MNKENSDTYSVTCRCPRILVFVLAAALVFGAVCVGGVSGADVWDGSADTSWYKSNQNTFTLTTAEQLAGLASLVNSGNTFDGKTINLGADLDLSGHEWTSIGYLKQSTFFDRTEVLRPFKGTFNGNGYTISGLSQNLGWNDEGGLFGYVVEGTVTGVNLINSEFIVTSTGITLGSLVGILEGGNVNNCVVSSVTFTSNIDWDNFWNALITSVIGSHTVGGAVGENDGGVVSGYDIQVDVEENLMNSWWNTDGCVFGEIVGKGGYLSAPKYYTITVDVGEHGSANPSDNIAYLPGDSAKYSFTPDSGYAVDKIFLDGNDVTSTVVSGDLHSTQTYSITNIQRDHAISVTFKPSPEFTIIIPPSLVLEEEETSGGSTVTCSGSMEVTAKDIWIPETASISMTVSSANGFKLVHKKDDSASLLYSLRVGDSTDILSNGGEVATFTQADYAANGSSPIKTVLNAKATGTPKYAGAYDDTLTFTVIYGTE